MPAVNPGRVSSCSHSDLRMPTLVLSPLERVVVPKHEETRQPGHSRAAGKWQKQKPPDMVASVSNPNICGAKAEDPYEVAASLEDTACPKPGGVSQLDHL